MRLSFGTTNSLAASAELELSRIFVWTCISACSQLFPIVDLRYVSTSFKAEKMPSLSEFVAFESKSNLTIFSISLMKKCLFGDISCRFLIMLLVSIVSLSLGSNKFGNNSNCDTNLLTPMPLLLISKESTILQLIDY